MKKILLVIFLSTTFISCRKFLEEYSPTDMKPSSTADFAEILSTDGYPERLQTLHSWVALLDDDVQCYVNSANQSVAAGHKAFSSNIYQWQRSLISDGEGSAASIDINAWGNYYARMMGVNVVLDHIDASTGDQADKEQLKGEALGLRAYYHFMLVNFYASPYNDSLTTPDKSPGIPIRTASGLSDAPLVRNSVREVYQQIVSDIDQAIALLSKSKQGGDVFRMNEVALHLLASRVYLYMEEWQKCVAHADVVIRKHPQLMNYNDWTAAPTLLKQLKGPGNVESLWCWGNQFEQHPKKAGYGITYEISHDLYNSLDAEDLRRKTGIEVIPEVLKRYIAIDFNQFKNLEATMAGVQSLVNNNSWRSSEAYLNRAEALIQLFRTKGDGAAAAEALKSLNTLREQRFQPSTFQPWTMQPADVLLDMCRAERRRELFKEEAHRWFDLRRYGMPEIKHIYKPSATISETYTLRRRDPQYILPIPEEVLLKNQALIQNPMIAGQRQAD
jgi:hypothetical protein